MSNLFIKFSLESRRLEYIGILTCL